MFLPGTVAIRRLARRVVAGALCAAALVASWSLLTGTWGDDDWRILGTSLAFAVCSTVFGEGAMAGTLQWDGARWIGSGTMTGAVATFVVTTAAIWGWDPSETAWRASGIVALATLVGAHTCMVNNMRRPTDSAAVGGLVAASTALVVLDAAGPAAALLGFVDEITPAVGRLLAVLGVFLVLTTVLPLVLRGRDRPVPVAGRSAAAAFGALRSTRAATTDATLADEVLATVERLRRLDLGPEVERELMMLAELARTDSAAARS